MAEEHDGDGTFKSVSGNMAISCMCNAFNHNYRNSLVIVDLAMGQIPCSTEHISSLLHNTLFTSLVLSDFLIFLHFYPIFLTLKVMTSCNFTSSENAARNSNLVF